MTDPCVRCYCPDPRCQREKQVEQGYAVVVGKDRIRDAAREIRDYVRDKFVYGSLDSLNELEIYVNKLIQKELR